MSARCHPEFLLNTISCVALLPGSHAWRSVRRYPDYAMAGYDLAKELAALITNYVDFGDHDTEFQRLQENLEPTES